MHFLPQQLGLTASEYVHIFSNIPHPAPAVLLYVSGSAVNKMTFLLFAEGDTADRIKMITTAFAAFTTLASSIQSNQREDVRSVAILLYSGDELDVFIIWSSS